MDLGQYSCYRMQLRCLPRLESDRPPGSIRFLFLSVQWLWCRVGYSENVAVFWVCAVLGIGRLCGGSRMLE